MNCGVAAAGLPLLWSVENSVIAKVGAGLPHSIVELEVELEVILRLGSGLW
jgi:hypothetical protein